MRYVGGKHRISKWVAEHVLALKGDRTDYLEPFVGSAGVFAAVAPEFVTATASDAHPDLMLMWEAIARGWIPPDTCTREEYAALRNAPPSAWRGLVGFGASFSGKWFGGYVNRVFDKHHQRDTKAYLGAARTSVLKHACLMGLVSLQHCDYSAHSPGAATLVYCDPPYKGTTGYSTGAFDHADFWDVMRQWQEDGALVVVSEETAPRDWLPLSTFNRKAFLQSDAVAQEKRVRKEVLWVHESVARSRRPVAPA